MGQYTQTGTILGATNGAVISMGARKDYAGFLQRLPVQLQRYDALGIGYAHTPFDVKADIAGDRQAGTATFTLGNPLGYPL